MPLLTNEIVSWGSGGRARAWGILLGGVTELTVNGLSCVLVPPANVSLESLSRALMVMCLKPGGVCVRYIVFLCTKSSVTARVVKSLLVSLPLGGGACYLARPSFPGLRSDLHESGNMCCRLCSFES